MKKKQIVKQTTNSKKKKIKWFDVFITAFAIVLVGGFLVGFVVYNYLQEKHERETLEKYKATLPAPGVAIDHKLVCMASDLYHGADQIAVIVSDKTYYGCSRKSVRQLNTDAKIRFGIDPYSKKPVDKALAFITISPTKPGTILYFESEENAKKYLGK